MSIPRFGPLAAAIALAVGIVAAPVLDGLGIEAWPRWALAAALVVIWRRHRTVVLIAAFAIGVARGAHAPAELPPGAAADDRIADRVVGVVRGPIAHGARGDAALLEPGEEASDTRGTGGAAIWVWTQERLVAGERIAATGLVHTPRGLRDPGVPDRVDATRARGAELEMTAQQIERLGDAAGVGDRAWRWAAATQAAWAHAIDAAGGDPVGSAAL
ncbi:MAG TPA: hypothetical protein VGD80_03005, partial [Kofleriaceae bacterium]